MVKQKIVLRYAVRIFDHFRDRVRKINVSPLRLEFLEKCLDLVSVSPKDSFFDLFSGVSIKCISSLDFKVRHKFQINRASC